MNCRHCNNTLRHKFVDLGYAPPSNAYLTKDDLAKPEIHYPLRVMVCDDCWLVQTEDFVKPDELFKSNYPYFSSTSATWLEHAKSFSNNIINRLQLGVESFVVEIASNDGYLLKNFLAAGIPCLGIEPTESTAEVAEAIGITVQREFFGLRYAQKLSEQGKLADLIIGNNVFAHVPDINDFSKGLCILLKPEGVVSLEFPHLMELILKTQFDTIYHEHYSYLSLSTVKKIFEQSDLKVWDVEKLNTHGGSLRVYGCRSTSVRNSTSRVTAMLETEASFGMSRMEIYDQFQRRAEQAKDQFLEHLLTAKAERRAIAAYGAAAKGNTLINFAGVKADLLPFVCDASTAKQGKYLPGSKIPILAPDFLRSKKIDELIVLPWNISNEIKMQLRNYLKPETKLLVAMPRLRTM
jgi:hypothetical protein